MKSDVMKINQGKEFKGVLFSIEHLFGMSALSKDLLEVKEWAMWGCGERMFLAE